MDYRLIEKAQTVVDAERDGDRRAITLYMLIAMRLGTTPPKVRQMVHKTARGFKV